MATEAEVHEFYGPRILALVDERGVLRTENAALRALLVECEHVLDDLTERLPGSTYPLVVDLPYDRARQLRLKLKKIRLWATAAVTGVTDAHP